MLRNLINWGYHLIHSPMRVFWVCMTLASFAVILDGTALRLWSLHRDHKLILARIEGAKSRSRQLEFRIHEAQSPEFIERAARDEFDLVKEGDLVFVFSEDSAEPAEKATE